MGAIALRRPPRMAFGSVAAALALLGLAFGLWLQRGGSDGPSPLSDSAAAAAIASAPLAFEAAAGRYGGGVRYVSNSVAGGSLYLRRDGALLQIPNGRHGARTLSLELLGASTATGGRGVGELAGKANSFIGDDPSRWRQGIPTFSRVRYDSIYPGIDLDFHGDQSELEYDFRLAPGAHPSRIAVGLAGMDSARIAPGGDLLFDLGTATVRQHAPVAYQWIDGERHRVDAAFDLRGSTLGFRLGGYDRARPLTIDPVLTYSTYLGGSKEDFGFDIAVDDSGAAYVTGQTYSIDLPKVDNPITDQALANAYVAKFDPPVDGKKLTLAYTTYLGASKDDFAGSIAVDDKGAAYVAGSTASNNFPTVDPLAGAAGGDLGSTDYFLVKLSPDTGGTVSIAYSTYISGSGSEFEINVAVDKDGAAYIAGSTDSTDYPLVDEYQPDKKDGDIVLTKVNPDSGGAVTLAYSTYFGGTANQERAGGLAVDDEGAAYIAGYTDGTDFPTQDPFQTAQGGFDGLVIKVDPDVGGPVTLAYSTHLGGFQGDFPSDIAVGSDGSAYVVGPTDSTNFPEVLPFESNQGGQDGFVTKLNPDSGGNVTVAYSTYLGGALSDAASGVAVDADGDAVVTGSTLSTEFPVSIEPLFEDMPDRDGFVTEFSFSPGKNVEVPFSTYLGGSGVDEASSVAVGPEGDLYVFGATTSTDLPLRNEFQGDQPDRDMFMALLGEPAKAGKSPPPGQKPGGGGDTTPPETRIDRAPRKKVRTRKARAKVALRFSSSEAGSRFECALDRGAFVPCSSPKPYRVKAKAKVKPHLLRVRATDAAGNADPTPAEARFKLERLPARPH